MTEHEPLGGNSEPEEQNDEIIGVALRWSFVAIVCLAGAGGGAAYWLTRPKPAAPIQKTELAPVKTRALPMVEPPNVRFADITKQAGITFVHENGSYGDKLLPETMGGGCAFFDFDNDGDQDLLLINSMRWPWDKRPNEKPATTVLYRNDGKGKFEDVTRGSGLDITCYGMGVACGDFDNDGLVDLFLSTVGLNRLFKNQGNGKFVDVTEAAGVAGDKNEWSTSCGWFDYDNDGDLDLFVCNYVKWSKEFDLAQNFQLVGGGRAFGRPQAFEGTFPYLYRNEGGGKFKDVSAASGVQVKNRATGVPLAKSLGVCFADFDGDGWIDIVVANDTVQNLLFHNQRNGTFEETAAVAGVAYDTSGNARGAMGIDVACFRTADCLGIAIGNFANEMAALYVGKGNELQFTDEAVATGLGPSTRLSLTFGVFYFDYDFDGRLDLLCANGHLEEDINRVQPSQHYQQPPQLFWNAGAEQGTEFVKVTEEHSGSDFLQPNVGRGATYADIDGDGDLDVLITSTGKAPRLLRNEQALGRHWVRFKLRGIGETNRDAIGSWITIVAKGKTQRKQVMPTRSYLSQTELPVTFGLGDANAIESAVIHWTDGTVQRLKGVAVDKLHVIEKSTSGDNVAGVSP